MHASIANHRFSLKLMVGQTFPSFLLLSPEWWSAHPVGKWLTAFQWQIIYNMMTWCHQMGTFSAFLAVCAGNSPVPGEFPAQRPVTQNFDVFFDLRLNKRLSKQSWGWWFQTLSRPLWSHCNEEYQKILADNVTMPVQKQLGFKRRLTWLFVITLLKWSNPTHRLCGM